MRDIALPGEVVSPWHAIQSSNGQFVVCHGTPNDRVHGLCTISADGHYILERHGGHWGSAAGEYNVPRHMAIDRDQRVVVDDMFNRRVNWLSPTLEFICEVVSRAQLKWRPCRLCLDAERSLLYVADNEREEGGWTSGRVVVFSI